MDKTETTKTAGSTGVARTVYLAATAMVIAFVATIAFVIEQSSREADNFALDAELRLSHLEFERLTHEAIREHSEIAYWDEAIDALAERGGEDMDFVQEEIADWMISELGFDWAATVSASGETGVAVIGEQILRDPKHLPIVEENGDIAAAARERYGSKRVHAGGGYIVPAGHGDVVQGLQATAYRAWNGKPGLVIAQVIVPETEEFAIDDGEDTVFIAYKPMTAQAVAEIGQRLGLPHPQIVPVAAVDPALPHIELPNASLAPELAFQWSPRTPRTAIIGSAVPLAIGLCALICAVMLFIVTRHGRTLRALSESEARNRHMATHDALTGLANRSQFDSILEGLTGPGANGSVAVLCIDLDRFKAVNDSHGHHAGDAVLRAVAKRFDDRIGDHGVTARIGGDEFIAVVTRNVAPDFLRWLGDSLVEDAAGPVSYHGHELVIGASVGVAIWPQDGRTAREVIAAADRLLYNSKGMGRGRVTMSGDADPLIDRRAV